MKNLIISHKEFQTAMFYCFSDGREIGKDLILGVSHDNDKFIWEAFVDGKQVATHSINRNYSELNSVRPHDYNNCFSSQWLMFLNKINPQNTGVDRWKDKIDDGHTLNEVIFNAYSELRKITAEGHELSVNGAIYGDDSKGATKWTWTWNVFDEDDNLIFKYSIDMTDERLNKTTEDVLYYLNYCFEEMVEMVKGDIKKGLIKLK